MKQKDLLQELIPDVWALSREEVKAMLFEKITSETVRINEILNEDYYVGLFTIGPEDGNLLEHRLVVGCFGPDFADIIELPEAGEKVSDYLTLLCDAVVNNILVGLENYDGDKKEFAHRFGNMLKDSWESQYPYLTENDIAAIVKLFDKIA